MLRTRKPIALAIMTLVVAGCAHSDRAPGSAQYPKFRSAKKSRTHKVRQQQPPKILPQTHFAAGTLFEALQFRGPLKDLCEAATVALAQSPDLIET